MLNNNLHVKILGHNTPFESTAWVTTGYSEKYQSILCIESAKSDVVKLEKQVKLHVICCGYYDIYSQENAMLYQNIIEYIMQYVYQYIQSCGQSTNIS